ncbi:MAG: aminotransferase class III-fold pyridoxal phosphate-dependent enzyme [Acidobacteriota bacterium]
MSRSLHHESKGSGRLLASSQAWRLRAERLIPGCAQTFSKGPTSFVQGVTPSFVSKAQGACFWDVDGNRYLDYIMGLGPVILGHADPMVNEAVRRQMELGMSFSLPHPIEVEVAELLNQIIPCAERVRFGKNGSDATAGAVRVARAWTKRDKVACCGYHGWQDWFIGSTNRHFGVPHAVRQLTLPFPYNDLQALHKLFREHKDQIACVIMEPVAFDPPLPAFLEGVKELCDKNGALLVFDEIITGFRLALGGAQEYFGVQPDLACFGKAMANGFPLSAIVGRADVLNLFEDVFFSFTFAGEAVSLAACQATIEVLHQRRGIPHLWRVGKCLQDGTNELIRELGLQDTLACVGLPPLTGFRFLCRDQRQNVLLRSLLQQEAVKRSILTHGNHVLSLAHDDGIIEETLQAYGQLLELVADTLRRGDLESCLEGPPIEPVLRQA